jgi:hypothetical protein
VLVRGEPSPAHSTQLAAPLDHPPGPFSVATTGLRRCGRSAQQHASRAQHRNRWDDATGSNLYEHLAGVNDLLLAQATFAAAVKRWPGAKITLRNGARIIPMPDLLLAGALCWCASSGALEARRHAMPHIRLIRDR